MPSRHSGPLLAMAASTATAMVAPSTAVAQLAIAGLRLAQALSAPVTLAGWSTAAAAVTHVSTVRVQFQETLARQAALACPPDALAFSDAGRERVLMRQADLAGVRLRPRRTN